MREYDPLTYRYPRSLTEAFGPGAALDTGDDLGEYDAVTRGLMLLLVALYIGVLIVGVVS